MLPALLTAFLSVILGAALGMIGPGRALGPVRALALGASLATVFGVLVPEAVFAAGATMLVPFFVGLLVPGLLERFGRSHLRTDGAALALEISYVGLLVHQIGDGLAMGAFSNREHEGHVHWEVLVAVAGHTVPIVAAVVIAFAELRGRASAIVRTLGLAVAAAVGVGITSSGWAAPILHEHQVWVSSVTAGLLLHVVLHGIEASPPRSATARLLELASFAVGAMVPMVLGHEHHDGAEAQPRLESLLPLALAAAPALAIGLAVASLVSLKRGESYLAKLDPLVPRVVPFALFGMVAVGALAPSSGSAWAVLAAGAASAVPAFLVERGRSGLGALARAGVVFAGAVGLSLGLGLTGVDPVALGATAILSLGLVVVRGALVVGVRALFGALLPLHEHDDEHHHEHDEHVTTPVSGPGA